MNCYVIDTTTIRLESERFENGYTDITPVEIVAKSPTHFIAADEKGLIQAEFLFGLNEILVRHPTYDGIQFPMNEHVVQFFTSK